jgi:hypothetical protein
VKIVKFVSLKAKVKKLKVLQNKLEASQAAKDGELENFSNQEEKELKVQFVLIFRKYSIVTELKPTIKLLRS